MFFGGQLACCSKPLWLQWLVHRYLNWLPKGYHGVFWNCAWGQPANCLHPAGNLCPQRFLAPRQPCWLKIHFFPANSLWLVLLAWRNSRRNAVWKKFSEKSSRNSRNPGKNCWEINFYSCVFLTARTTNGKLQSAKRTQQSAKQSYTLHFFRTWTWEILEKMPFPSRWRELPLTLPSYKWSLDREKLQSAERTLQPTLQNEATIYAESLRGPQISRWGSADGPCLFLDAPSPRKYFKKFLQKTDHHARSGERNPENFCIYLGSLWPAHFSAFIAPSLTLVRLGPQILWLLHWFTMGALEFTKKWVISLSEFSSDFFRLATWILAWFHAVWNFRPFRGEKTNAGRRRSSGAKHAKTHRERGKFRISANKIFFIATKRNSNYSDQIPAFPRGTSLTRKKISTETLWEFIIMFFGEFFWLFYRTESPFLPLSQNYLSEFCIQFPNSKTFYFLETPKPSRS